MRVGVFSVDRAHLNSIEKAELLGVEQDVVKNFALRISPSVEFAGVKCRKLVKQPMKFTLTFSDKPGAAVTSSAPDVEAAECIADLIRDEMGPMPPGEYELHVTLQVYEKPENVQTAHEPLQ